MASKWSRAIPVVLVVGVLACSDDGGPTAEPDPSAGRQVVPAADTRFDDANAFIIKGKALLNAAENPLARKPDRPFGGHRTKAVSLLERAQREIATAKAYADDPKNQAP